MNASATFSQVRPRRAVVSTTHRRPRVARRHLSMPVRQAHRDAAYRLDINARVLDAARSCVRALTARWGTYDAVATAIGYNDSSAIRHMMGSRGSLLGTAYLVRLSEAAQEHGDCYDLAFAFSRPGVVIAACLDETNGSLDDERADALVELGRITAQETDARAALPAAQRLISVAQRFAAELRARLERP